MLACGFPRRGLRRLAADVAANLTHLVGKLFLDDLMPKAAAFTMFVGTLFEESQLFAAFAHQVV